MSTEIAKLRRIVEKANLVAGVVELGGPFTRRLDRERAPIPRAGPWATFAGEVRRLGKRRRQPCIGAMLGSSTMISLGGGCGGPFAVWRAAGGGSKMSRRNCSSGVNDRRGQTYPAMGGLEPIGGSAWDGRQRHTCGVSSGQRAAAAATSDSVITEA
jgi:hypothetical protein